MPREVIDAWDYFYHKQKMKRNKGLKVKEVKENKDEGTH